MSTHVPLSNTGVIIGDLTIVATIAGQTLEEVAIVGEPAISYLTPDQAHTLWTYLGSWLQGVPDAPVTRDAPAELTALAARVAVLESERFGGGTRGA